MLYYVQNNKKDLKKRKENHHGCQGQRLHQKTVKHYTTDRLREEFLIQDLFQADKINLVYSHIDRIITGAAVPGK